MKNKRSVLVLFIFLLTFLSIFLFSFSLINAYNWREQYVIDSSRAYFVEQDGDFHSVKITNAIDDPTGTMQTSKVEYIDPSGNVNTLEISAPYVQKNGQGNFDCYWLPIGPDSHIREYETFTNPSIYSDENGEIRIVFSKILATRDSACPRIFGTPDDEVRIKGSTSDNQFFVQIPSGGGLLTTETNIYPDERCINRFDISSQTQRVVVDDKQRTFVTFVKQNSFTLSNCDAYLDDYETDYKKDANYQTDAHYQTLIRENFQKKFDDGIGIEICNVHMADQFMVDIPQYCRTALSGLNNKFPTLIINKENKGFPSDNYDTYLIYVKQNENIFNNPLSYDISYLTYRGVNPDVSSDYPKLVAGVVNIANLPKDVVIESLSGAVDPTTKKPGVIFYDPIANKVSVIHYQNNQWKITVVEDRPFETGEYPMPGMRSPNLEFDSGGGIHVSYVVNNGDLRYGYLHPGSSTFELQTVNGPAITSAIDTEHSTFISRDDNNYPHIYLNGRHYSIVELEICNNGIDDNANTYTDCDDFGCYEHPSCLQAPVCGDGILSTGEQCDDGNKVNGDGCSSTCTLELPENCGNGVVESGETCDTGLADPFEGKTCSDFDSFTGGSLSCSSSCQINTNSCTGGTSGTCGNGAVNTGETCDGTEFNGLTCSDFDNFNDVNSLSCDSVSCLIDTSSCTGGTFVCGNGIVESVEECDDGNNFNGDGCSGSCLLEDGASCNNNGAKETGEYCDGSDGLNPPACQDLGYDGGNLGCTNLCGYDVSECSICGNNICETGETSTNCAQDCIVGVGEVSCAQYTTESSCNNGILTNEINNTIEAMNPQFQSGFCGDPSLTFEPDIEGQSYSSEACGDYFSCKCKWFVDDQNPSGICDGITKIKRNNQNDCGINELNDYFCRTSGSGVIGSCTAGNEYTLTWTAQAYDSNGNLITTPFEWCQSGTKNFPCPSSSKVPFFNTLNLIIALVFIGVVYYLYYLLINKKKKLREQKRK